MKVVSICVLLIQNTGGWCRSYVVPMGCIYYVHEREEAAKMQ